MSRWNKKAGESLFFKGNSQRCNGGIAQRETLHIGRAFDAVTAGTNNQQVQAWLAWRTGEQGQALIDQTGYVPVE